MTKPANTKTKIPRNRPRRAAKEGYAAGARTRQKIIDTAIEVFATQGYPAASTRKIAQLAGVNLAAVQYYFGGKEALYHACADYISQYTQDSLIGPITTRIERALNDATISREELLMLLQSIIDTFSDRLIREREPMHWLMFFIRGGDNPAAASAILNHNLLQRYIHAVAKLMARLIDCPPDDPVTILRAFFTVTQFQSFLSMREAVLQLMDWDEFTGERIELVKYAMWRQMFGPFAIAKE